MNGTAVEIVASSWIEALGGVSMCWMRSTPPDFWAQPGPAVTLNAVTTLSNAYHEIRLFMFVSSRPRGRAVTALRLHDVSS